MTLSRIHILVFLSALLTQPLQAQETTASAADSIRVQFDPPAGHYSFALTVELYAAGAEAIFYTLDGSPPNQRSTHYQGPIKLDKSSVLRVAAYRHGKRSPLHGATYLLNEPASSLPTVSIGIQPSLLFHPERGIFMQGSKATDSLWNKPGANFWTRREFPTHIEIWEDDGRTVYNSLSGLRLFGGMSRLFPQKSMAIVARKRYGDARIDYPIFGEEGPKKFKYLVLRNSGSDFGKSHFRDGLMTGLVKDWDLETQDFRPAHVYLNGEYWGIYNIREKVNRYFLNSHQADIDKDSVDIIEHYMTRKRGKKEHYIALLRVLERYDPNDPDVWAHIHAQMDVDNFMRYQIAQIYFDNRDAGGNIRFWRPQTEDGRWRWILYDTDWGFGLHQPKAYQFNSLAFHTDPAGPSWPNPPWSTFLLRKLLQNDRFKTEFVNRFADALNTNFQPEQVLTQIDSLYALYAPEMHRHLQRWHLPRSRWEDQVQIMRNYAIHRPDFIRDHLREMFAAGEDRQLQLSSSGGGHILFNQNLEVGRQALEGLYFAHYPLQLRAVPHYGYRFVRWEGLPPSFNPLVRELRLSLSEQKRYRVSALFEPFRHPLQDQIVINEVCAKNKKTGDWLELHNRTRQAVDLQNWVLTDLKNEFRLPAVVIGPRDYLIICKDVDRFRTVFPSAYHVLGGLPFGIHKRKEALALYSENGAAVDSMSYDLPPLDTAFSLSLLLPELDNGDLDNWEIRPGNGTPNLPNPYYVSSYVRAEQSDWFKMGLAAGIMLLCLFLLKLRR